MKKLILLFLFAITFQTFAGLTPKRERLFHCRNFGHPEEVEELFILESRFGQNIFHEVEVPYSTGGEKKTLFRKLNLISKYGGRVLLFTTGNYRVKIDRAIPVEMKYRSFVRLPQFDVHSKDWFCKDY